MTILRAKDYQWRHGIGSKGVDVVADYLTGQGCVVKKIIGEFKSYDITSELNCRNTTYEVKTGTRAEAKGIHYIESYRCIDRVWQNYGITSTAADEWVFVSESKIIFIETEILKNLLLIHCRWEKTVGRLDNAPKHLYTCPIDLLEKYSKVVVTI